MKRALQVVPIAAVFAAFACNLRATAQAQVPTPTFPPDASYTVIATPAAVQGCADQRDVVEAAVAIDSDYLFLRLQVVSSAGWPDGPGPGSPAEEARLKWWIDTMLVNAELFERSGQVVNGGEFLLMLEDLTDNANDPTLTRDQLGELTLLDDLTNGGMSARWDTVNPPLYTTNPSPAPGSTLWRRALGSGTAEGGGPQSGGNADIGYRLNGAVVDTYVKWSALQSPSQVCLL